MNEFSTDSPKLFLMPRRLSIVTAPPVPALELELLLPLLLAALELAPLELLPDPLLAEALLLLAELADVSPLLLPLVPPLLLLLLLLLAPVLELELLLLAVPPPALLLEPPVVPPPPMLAPPPVAELLLLEVPPPPPAGTYVPPPVLEQLRATPTKPARGRPIAARRSFRFMVILHIRSSIFSMRAANRSLAIRAWVGRLSVPRSRSAGHYRTPKGKSNRVVLAAGSTTQASPDGLIRLDCDPFASRGATRSCLLLADDSTRIPDDPGVTRRALIFPG
jgi:hypothetical protein